MISTIHLQHASFLPPLRSGQASLDRVAREVERALEAQGFVRDDAVLACPGAPGTRRIALYEERAWIGLADEPFTTTDWGAILSRALDAPVFVMEGEGDHAFFSSLTVYEDGQERHASHVPGEEKLGEDGRHRIRPAFIAKYVPAASAALFAGIAVNPHGGAENVHAVGVALGIPRPLFSVFDEEGARTLLGFRFARDVSVVDDDSSSDLLGDGLLASAMNALGVPVDALLTSITEQLLPGARRGGAPALDASPSRSGTGGFVGKSERLHCTYALVGAERAQRLVVELAGPGLALFGVTAATARVGQNAELVGVVESRAPTRVVFRFDDVVLTQAPSPDLDALPPRERARQAMQRMNAMGMFADPALVTVHIEGVCIAVGSGEMRMRGTVAGPRGPLSAACEQALEVKPALRLPVLPAWVTPNLEVQFADADNYAQRCHGFGWVAFDAPWAELAPHVLERAAALVRVLLASPLAAGAVVARVTRKGGERLEFRGAIVPELSAPACDPRSPWARIAAELERGADVSLARGEAYDGPSVDIVHQPGGPNLLAGMHDEPNPRRGPTVVLGWTLPRACIAAPDAVDVPRLMVVARDVLHASGDIASHVGGLVSAQHYPPRSPMWETAYESLAETRMKTYDVRFLRDHVRSPGWLVLVPERAVAALPGAAESAARANIAVTKLAHGLLLASPARDCFAYDGRDAKQMETLVLPAVGTAERVAPVL